MVSAAVLIVVFLSAVVWCGAGWWETSLGPPRPASVIWSSPAPRYLVAQ